MGRQLTVIDYFFFRNFVVTQLYQEVNLEDKQIIISRLVILTNSIRLILFLAAYTKQSLDYYTEIQGASRQRIHINMHTFYIIIRNLCKGRIPLYQEIEYFYISSNETQSQLNIIASTLLIRNSVSVFQDVLFQQFYHDSKIVINYQLILLIFLNIHNAILFLFFLQLLFLVKSSIENLVLLKQSNKFLFH
ncbi:unnamed protein product [Paramecium octaurelia]|uniref:Transmembrane protein n=1 Tax=Paramecium octaurelia TaxID=43137 RepID=A0A8S1TMJ1_PAROT|nr:unnamed protein product [Paramecium octaurelia]